MKKTALFIACAGLIVGGMTLAAPKSADAGIRFSIGTRSGGFGYSNYSRRGYNYNRGYNNFNRGGIYGHRGYGNYGRSRSFGRGHYDYHPPSLRRHGNHLDIVPGHYDYHRGGHHGHH